MVIVAILVGCQGAIKGMCPLKNEALSKSIYVVSHGWHTGIVFKRDDINDRIWPENKDFFFAEYIEVGWGDAGFYQASEISVWLGIKALLWPTESVLHIVGFNGQVMDYFPASEIVEIKVSKKALDALSAFIQNAYQKDDNNRSVKLGPGLYGKSAFYAAVENYHLFNTCNVWTARAIRTAGCPITPLYAFSTTNVIYQTRQFGEKK